MRAAAAVSAAGILAAAVTTGPASALPPAQVAALVAVDAQPVGPPQPTRQRTRCARGAPATTDLTALPPGHVLLDLPGAWRFSRGAGVTVAVIDTGVTPHGRLPRLTGGGDYVSAGDGLTDCDLHGTVVAGIIAGRSSAADGFAGVAPEAAVVSIRQSSGAYDAVSRESSDAPAVGAGYGPLSTLAKAIAAAVEAGAGVINISETACAPSGSGIDDDAIASALDLAHRRDAVVVAAAGNVADTGSCREQNPLAAASESLAYAGVTTVATPARFGPAILTVGAVDTATGLPADFSLRGPWVSVAAPGTRIVGLAAGRPIDALDGADGPRPLAGTSYAAAYVSGVAALVRAAFPRLSADEVIDRIVRTARGGSAGDQAIGAGLVDPVAALTAQLPAGDSLPDPRTGKDVAAPEPERPDHTASIAVTTTLALGTALLAAVFALTRAARPRD
ncbi:type VII secretion-associated serine protease mycosin [Gordonia sp. FQ]|uniref:type VII secretion-associated serine protease mycosin n=1 Tax=Gordonia sp. FQ TaxID=3446634 RepID=UPI003F87CD81